MIELIASVLSIVGTLIELILTITEHGKKD